MSKEKISYDRLLQIAKKMHCWIFLNTCDEQAVYDELGLTDEEDYLLGSLGSFEAAAARKVFEDPIMLIVKYDNASAQAFSEEDEGRYSYETQDLFQEEAYELEGVSADG